MPFFIKPSKITIDEAEILDAYVEQLKLDSAKWVEDRKLRYTKRKDSINRLNRKKQLSFSKGNENKQKQGFDVNETPKWNPHQFNPNEANTIDWKSVGMNEGQINSINKYLKNGGVFKKNADVEKMYVIDKSQYEKMQPYLVIPKSDNSEKSILGTGVEVTKGTVKTEVRYAKGKNYVLDSFSIELNTTDTIQLKRIRGIGSYYARQIIYYREKLGGFYSTVQLYEVERMREETVIKILPYVRVDASMVKKIHINSDIAAKMVKHPYITWNMAITIQDHRDFSRKFKSVHELVKKGLLNEELYSKLAPYLEL